MKSGRGDDHNPSIRVQLLGQPFIFLEERQVRIPPSSLVFMLLVRTLLTPPHRFRRVELADMMWPDSLSPMNNLRQLLFRMKPVLEELSPVFATDRDTVFIKNPERILLDIHDFQFPFHCQPPHPPEHCPSCFSDLEHSLSLYTGAFLEGWDLPGSEPFDDWALSLRNQLEALSLDRLKKVLSHYRRRGDIHKVLFYARMLSSAVPDQEDFQAELFLALDEAGCHEEIVERFKEVRARSRELFGAEPEERIRKVYERAVQGKGCQAFPTKRTQEPLLEWRHMTYIAIAFSFPGLSDPEEQFQWAEKAIGICSKWIEHYGGTALQSFGTLILGAFGHPFIQEQMSIQALFCALRIQKAMQSVESGQGVCVQIGIHGENTIVPDTKAFISLSDKPVKATLKLAEQAGPFEVLASGPALARTKGHVRSLPLSPGPVEGEEDRFPVHRILSPIDSRQRFSQMCSAPETPFVGRISELERLREIWERVLQSQCALFGIRGEKGMGKSRLLSCFLKQAGADPSHIRMIFCRPDRQGTPFFPIIEEIRTSFAVESILTQSTLEKMFDVIEIRPGTRNRVGKVLAQLMEVPLELPGEKGLLPPEILHQEAIEFLTAFLLRRSPKSPLIVGVEDIHWADPLTMKVLKRVGVAPPPAPFLLLFTSRNPPDRPGGDFSRVEHVFLEPISSGEIRELVQEMDPQERISPENRKRIERESDGIPLFVEELVRLFRDAPAGDSLPPGSVPEILDDYLTHRLQTAGSNRFLLGKASVIGQCFTRDLLLAICSEDERKNFDSRLEGLTRSGLIKPSEVEGTPLFAFSSALLRHKAYSSLTDRTRRALHRQVLQSLETQAGKTVAFPDEAIEYHREMASDRELLTMGNGL